MFIIRKNIGFILSVMLAVADVSLSQPGSAHAATADGGSKLVPESCAAVSGPSGINACTGDMALLIDMRWYIYAADFASANGLTPAIAAAAAAKPCATPTAEELKNKDYSTLFTDFSCLFKLQKNGFPPTAMASQLGLSLTGQVSAAAMLKQMFADRNTARATLDQRLGGKAESQYPSMAEAQVDLYAIYLAGQEFIAASAVDDTISAKTQACKNQITAMKTTGQTPKTDCSAGNSNPADAAETASAIAGGAVFADSGDFSAAAKIGETAAEMVPKADGQSAANAAVQLPKIQDAVRSALAGQSAAAQLKSEQLLDVLSICLAAGSTATKAQ